MLSKNLIDYQAVLFDLDGTLLDTAPDLVAVLNRLLQCYERPLVDFESARPYVAEGSRGLIEMGFQMKAGEGHYAQLRQEFLDLYLENIFNQTCFFPGMEQVLQYLERQKVPWGIVTNKPAYLTDALLTALQMPYTPQCVVSGDTCARPKPAPDSILFACELLKVHSGDCVYIGDTEGDVIAAREAGMPVILAKYGYVGVDSKGLNISADGYIEKPLELLN